MYNLPPSTLINRVIPKKVFVDKLGVNTRMKDHFTNDIIKPKKQKPIIQKHRNSKKKKKN